MFGKDVTITITCSKEGKINVNGPLDNKVAMYGLLEIAKETVSKWNDVNGKQAVDRRIVEVPNGFQLPKA